MRKGKFSKVMGTIGQEEGISAKEVERKIQLAIDSGFDNPDEKVQAEWAKIPFKGERPTPEEVIEYMCKKLKLKQNQ
ncbi:sporulation initiation factor Spo0A C-terminal domain-containing protein [Extibacter sp. GGCC_0201]|uniref:sporulation initiation factor Spo0A C-terminal domain-containing protein n=1 Tax=Extibacter sp. GGCC_0201 TaxID=2731209 RepID=UPI001AA198FF|nr:sporulation initiation factor Spo0A C-terminal domain-containing protein [Extibacter sp. GGCC_0201]MBO1720094.1 sporulation initiation factor Spo0A [Extibacter sp. GGCC_0201]